MGIERLRHSSPAGTCRKQTTDSSGPLGQGLEVVGLRAAARQVRGEIVVGLDEPPEARRPEVLPGIHSLSARQRRVPSNDSL